MPRGVTTQLTKMELIMSEESIQNKTHYRKAFNSPYLSSADIVEPVNLTIKHVVLEPDKTKRTKEHFNTLYFAEKEIRKGETLKPMILNATNSRLMDKLAGSPFIEDWHDLTITVYVDPNVRFGRETVEGLRISPKLPSVKKELTPNDPMWQGAIDAYKRDGNLSKVLARVTISEENQRKIIEEFDNA